MVECCLAVGRPRWGHESGIQPAELVAVQRAEVGQGLLAVFGQLYADHPGIVRMGAAVYQASGLGPVDQFHNTVMTQLEPLRQFPDRRPFPVGESFQRQ